MDVKQRTRPQERLTHEHLDTVERVMQQIAQVQEDAEMSRPLHGMGGGVAKSPDMPMPRLEEPQLGATVIYRARTRGYLLAAIVTANVKTLDRRGVIRGDVPDITGEEHVHLNVQTCGAQRMYQEFDIPFSREPEPGTWGWA